jgi:AcrR family transcriptional regulator
MANQTETRPRQGGDNLDRPIVLRKVMEVLSAKGFAKTSIADLTSATGLAHGALHKAFGTRHEILRAAIRFCAETEVCLAQEPLRVSRTGREAILAMFEENVRLRRHWPRHCGCLFMFNAFIVPPDEAELQDFLTEKRRSLSKHMRARLARSVRERELPEGANCEALANLCLTLLSGLTFRVLDGAPPSLLFRSIELFVKGLGFRVRRNHSGTRAGRRSAPNRVRNS